MERINTLQGLIQRRRHRDMESAIRPRTVNQGTLDMTSPGNVNVALSNVWNSSENRVPVFNNVSAPSSSAPPTVISCQLCPAEIVLLQPDLSAPKKTSNLLKNLGFQLALNKNEMPEIFTNEMSYFCNDCKDDLEQMWKLHKQTSDIALRLQRKVVNGRQEGVVRKRKPLVSGAVDAPKFIQLRDLIVQNYYKNKWSRKPLNQARDALPEAVGAMPASSLAVLQPNVAPAVSYGNSNGLFHLRSSTPQPKRVVIKQEPVSLAAEVETAATDDESVFMVEPPVGRKRVLCHGVEVLECVSQNQMKFHQCAACPYRLQFSTDEEKVEMRKRMGIHIKNCHKKPQATKTSTTRRGPRPRKYCCKVCKKTFAYRKCYRDHRRSHPEFLNGNWDVPVARNEVRMPVLSPQVVIPEVNPLPPALLSEVGTLFNSNGIDGMPAGTGDDHPPIHSVVVKHEVE